MKIEKIENITLLGMSLSGIGAVIGIIFLLLGLQRVCEFFLFVALSGLGVTFVAVLLLLILSLRKDDEQYDKK